jgi:hypothetical protein
MDAELIDTKQVLKDATRSLIFQADPVLKKNLQQKTQILHSNKYPTQVFRLKDRKYIRVNSSDIQSFDVDASEKTEDLLKLLLSIDNYSSYGDEEAPELSTVIEEGVEEYKSFTGEDLSETDLIEFDEFRNHIGEEFPLTLKDFGTKPSNEEPTEQEKEEEHNIEEDTSISDETAPLAQATGMDGTKEEDRTVEMKDTVSGSEEVEQALNDIDQYASKSEFSSNHKLFNKEQLLELNQLSKKLLRAFKGSKSKQKTITPKKYINAKSLSLDSDRVYITKKDGQGKHIKFNLVVDMSGSMSGSPLRNAISILYLFNKLAQQGYVTGHILYSETRSHHKITMPVPDAEILSLNVTGGAEGLARTTQHYQEDLKNTNLICITDGDIVDEPIDKQFWLRNKIVSTGVYVHPSVENVLDFTGKMDKWFNHSLVRQNLNDLIELLVRIGIKG